MMDVVERKRREQRFSYLKHLGTFFILFFFFPVTYPFNVYDCKN